MKKEFSKFWHGSKIFFSFQIFLRKYIKNDSLTTFQFLNILIFKVPISLVRSDGVIFPHDKENFTYCPEPEQSEDIPSLPVPEKRARLTNNDETPSSRSAPTTSCANFTNPASYNPSVSSLNLYERGFFPKKNFLEKNKISGWEV